MSLALTSNAIDATPGIPALPAIIEREVGQTVVLTFTADAAGGNATVQGVGSLPTGLSVAPGSDLDESGGAITPGASADLVIQCDQAGEYVITVGGQPIALTVTAAPVPDPGRVFTRRVYSDKVYDARAYSPLVYGPAMTPGS